MMSLGKVFFFFFFLRLARQTKGHVIHKLHPFVTLTKRFWGHILSSPISPEVASRIDDFIYEA